MIMKKVKSSLLFLSGFLTIFLKHYIPIGGGGASIIFLISIPILLILGILFSLGYYYFIDKIRNQNIKNSILIMLLCIIVGLSLYFFPYQ